MATTMPTVKAEVSAPPDWAIELSNKGWELEGIDLKDEATMNDIYEDLGIQGDSKDHRKLRNGLRSYIVKKQQARAVDAREPKKTRVPSLQDQFCWVLDKEDFKGAWGLLSQLARGHISEETVEPKVYRFPATQLWETWEKDAMRGQLIAHRDCLRPDLFKYQREDRTPVVIGVRMGSGYGKTHVLTEAPTLLGIRCVYVTYNLKQALALDKVFPAKCFLFRGLLAILGCKPPECYKFFKENERMLTEVSVDDLRKLFVLAAGFMAKRSDLILSVDEVMELGEEIAGLVVSELCETAAAYTKAHSNVCIGLVSSLEEKAFTTMSARPVRHWAPKRPDAKALVYFASHVPKEMRAAAVALANAVCGRHMRSIVTAFEFIGQDMTCSVEYLFNQVADRLGNQVSDTQLEIIRGYVKARIETKGMGNWEGIESLMDDTKVVPPIFIKLAFDDSDAKTKEYLGRLLHAFSLNDGGAGKHLENVGKWFDLFRSSLELPVVPANAVVRANPRLCKKEAKPVDWFYGLRFSPDLSEDRQALLKEEQTIEATDDGPKTNWKTKPVDPIPVPEKYYHPRLSNHPWVDRAYVAIHPSKRQQCLVLVQDKVNKTDYGTACMKLNAAANMLVEHYKDANAGIDQCLLIVHDIGASTSTYAHKTHLEWPYLLVREKEEVTKFYSVNFVEIVWYARERHLLSI